MTITQEIWQVSDELARRRKQATRKQTGGDEERVATMFAQRYGVEGPDAATLQAIGDRYKLTRERVRQITTKTLAHAKDLPVPTPCLDQLAAAIEQYLPASVDDLDEKLRDLLGPKLTVRDAQRFAAEVLGKKVVHLVSSPFEQSFSRTRIAVDAEIANQGETSLRLIVSCARKLIRATGAAQIHAVTGMAADELGKALSAEEVRRWCAAAPGFEWLDSQTGWFWFGANQDNRLFSVVRKQLAAARGRLDIADVHAGMSAANRVTYRERREHINTIDAPAYVLAEVLSRLPWLKMIQHNDVLPATTIDESAVLSDVERAIVDLIRARKTVASKAEIDRHIENMAIATPVGVAMALARSPIFTKLGRGLYAIRGTTIDPAGLQQALLRVGGESRATIVHSNPADGTLTWPVTITESAHKNRPRAHVPAMLAKAIEAGPYHLVNPPANVHIYIPENYSDAYARGILGPLVRAGFVPGQTVLLQVHPETRTISVAPDCRPAAPASSRTT